jgi:hypothetical protein
MYYAKNKAKVGAATTAYRKRKSAEKKAADALIPTVVVQRACQDCGVDITHSYVSKNGCRCKACVATYQKAYRGNNLQRIADSKKAWKLKNKEHVETKDRAYALLYPDRRTLARRKWSTANPGKDNASKTLNSIARKKRIPVWLSDDDKWMLDQAYELAVLRTKMFGFAWHVDHVIPLNGRKVSGLHTPYNVQVIPWLENLRKGNRVQHGQ